MNTSSIHRWLADGFIAGEQVTPGAPWQIRITDELRARIVQQAPPEYLPMLETTMKLGVSRQTVLQRVKRGELQAVLVRQGRRKGLRIKVIDQQPPCSNSFHESGGSMKPYPKISPDPDPPPSGILRRYTAAPLPPPDAPSAQGETRSCVQKTSGPTALQNLHHRLLDQPIQHRRNAQLAHPSVRLRDFHP